MPRGGQLRTGEPRTLYPVACWLVRRHGSLAQLDRALWREGIEPLNALDAGSTPAGALTNPDGGMTLNNTNHTNLFIESVNIPYRRRRVKFARQPRFTANEYPAPDESKRVLHTVPCKTGLSVPAIKTDKYLGSGKPNLMDAVNGNATENLYRIARCCSGIANIHEETF